jgi:hypothetical protein
MPNRRRKGTVFIVIGEDDIVTHASAEFLTYNVVIWSQPENVFED